jgi:hypothetical protein
MTRLSLGTARSVPRSAPLETNHSFTLEGVNRLRTSRSCAVVWLLCAMLLWLAIDSPHCDVCDGAPFVAAASRSAVHQHIPAAPDTCNGHCSCCVLQGIPIVAPALEPSQTASKGEALESPRNALFRPSTVFRPPRITNS